MCKRIKQDVNNNSVFTRTVGYPEGSRKSFDVEVFSPTMSAKRAAELVIKREGERAIVLDGHQLRSLKGILDEHFNTLDEINYSW